jgi:single-strand DNA-binding protein
MADTHVTIAGNLTADPELKFTTAGDQVCGLRVAVTTRVPDGHGGWRDGATSFFRVSVWRAQAEHAAESLGKGARVLVCGRLRQRSWETDDGEQRSLVEIDADEVAASLKFHTATLQHAGRAGNGEAKPAGQTADDPPF